MTTPDHVSAFERELRGFAIEIPEGGAYFGFNEEGWDLGFYYVRPAAKGVTSAPHALDRYVLIGVNGTGFFKAAWMPRIEQHELVDKKPYPYAKDRDVQAFRDLMVQTTRWINSWAGQYAGRLADKFLRQKLCQVDIWDPASTTISTTERPQ